MRSRYWISDSASSVPARLGVAIEHLEGVVAAQFGAQLGAEELLAHRRAQDRHRVEVRLDRRARHALERGLAAQHARRPVELGIEPPERTEHRSPHRQRQQRAHPLFHQVQPVAPVAAEALVAAVAGQRDGDVLAGELADAVGRNRRAVGVGLVVERRERVDEVEVVALDAIDEVPRVVAIGHLLGERRLVELGVGERDRAGVDRVGGHARHHRDDRAGIDAAGEERTQRHLGDHPQPDRLAQPCLELGAGVGQA